MGMAENNFWRKNVHIVGIKGTGCAALVGILLQQECRITGSDGPADFYTCQMLNTLGIAYHNQFCADHVPQDTDLVIHSAAYGAENPEIQAAQQRGIPLLSYPEALGAIGKSYFSVAVAGVHGKTTTSALCGVIAKMLNEKYALGANVLVGSAVPAFNNQAVLLSQGEIFIAETCEYRRHFLLFAPQVIILTSIEWDHQDYFSTPEDIEHAFLELCQNLPQKGILIACTDDHGVQQLILQLHTLRPDIQILAYGQHTQGSDWQISDVHMIQQGHQTYQQCRIDACPYPVQLQVPGLHNLYNATAALALFSVLMAHYCPQVQSNQWQYEALQALAQFSGTKRRAEIIGRVHDVLIMDDYGHHPTAMATTLAGIKEFYQPKRLIVSFMSHTYSRTAAQLKEFAQSLACADVLILHKIYASAREVFHGDVTGETLFQECQALYPERIVIYFAEPMEALPFVKNLLQQGDLFLTLGAGDNFHLSHTLYKEWV